MFNWRVTIADSYGVMMDGSEMEEAFAQWGSERGYNVNLCDREAFEAAWNIAYAIGRRDADADWTDDVAEVEARLKAKEGKCKLKS